MLILRHGIHLIISRALTESGNKVTVLTESFGQAVAEAPGSDDAARLERLKTIFSSIPEGAALLALAEQNDMKVLFKRDLPGRDRGRVDYLDHAIYIDPEQDDADALTIMAHELRHLWQACISAVGFSVFSFPQIFVYMRVIEGDAYAFSMRFVEKLREKTGQAILHHNFTRDGILREMYYRESLSIRGEMRVRLADVPDLTEPPSEKIDLKEAFLNFQGTQNARAYDQSVVSMLESIQADIDGGEMSEPVLQQIFRRVSNPPVMGEDVTNITIADVDFDGIKYLDFKSVEDLTSMVLAHVPPGTLERARKLVDGIKRSAGFAMGLTP